MNRIEAKKPNVTGKPERSRLVTEFEVAEWIRLSVKTLRKWRTQGNGPPFIKANGSVRYRALTVESWLAERECSSTTAAQASSRHETQ